MTEVVGFAPSSPWSSYPGSGWNVGPGIGYGSGAFIPNPGNTTQVRDADEKDCSETSANPVVLTTGNKVESFLDFSGAGEMGLSLQRTYNHYWTHTGLFGRYWISNFDYSLVHESASATTIWAQRPDGRDGSSSCAAARKAARSGFWRKRPTPPATLWRESCAPPTAATSTSPKSARWKPTTPTATCCR